ncbi:MAG TPA: serine hydrolase [Rubrobacter sp.]|nr:serine hydrolase [Rubrobacter sp.]
MTVPAVEPQPEAPLPGPRSEPRTDSQAGARRDDQVGVEAVLSRNETAPLRSELVRIREAYPARYGVVVLDPSTDESVKMDADATFLAASLNKLAVLMALYRSAAGGEVDLDDKITMQASDVQAYGTGVLYTRPVGHTLTLRECANLLIKESDNTAWKMLDRYLGRDYIRAELYRVGARSTEYWIPNTTTPNDVLLMLKKISDPSYTTPDLSAEMLEVMTNTAFEDRLPQPLPEGTRVSHKIGSYGTTFSDAGLVFPEGSRDTKDAYFIVVMASDTGEYTARAAMREMSLATYRSMFDTGDKAGDRMPASH